jgi:hypothetical protein
MNKIASDSNMVVGVFLLRSGDNWREKLEQHVLTNDIFSILVTLCGPIHVG